MEAISRVSTLDVIACKGEPARTVANYEVIVEAASAGSQRL